MADEEYCGDCKSYTPSIYDYNTGDTICLECGLVLESRFIEETPRWRHYNDNLEKDDDDDHDDDNDNGDDGGDDDHSDGDGEDEHCEQGSLVSDPFNPLLVISEARLSTLITHTPSSDDNNSDMVNTGNNQGGINNAKTDRNLAAALRTMDQMADNLGLVWTVKNHAKELYKRADGDGIFKFRRYTKASMLACFYLASQEEYLPMTLKEIETFAVGVRAKMIHKAIGLFKKHFKIGRNYDRAQDLEIGERFCSNLGLDHRVIQAVREVLQKAQEFQLRRKPSSILAATIYMVDQLSSENKMHFQGLKEVAKACNVSEETLKKAYRVLHPLALVLIPSWYANAEDIQRLHIH